MYLQHIQIIEENPMHPSHENQIARLKKAEGQVRGIQTMIEKGDIVWTSFRK